MISGPNEKTTVSSLSIDAFKIYVIKAFIVCRRNLNKNNVQCINPSSCYRKTALKCGFNVSFLWLSLVFNYNDVNLSVQQ